VRSNGIATGSPKAFPVLYQAAEIVPTCITDYRARPRTTAPPVWSWGGHAEPCAAVRGCKSSSGRSDWLGS